MVFTIAVQTTPIGLLVATMLLATGNLLLPMAAHAMLDCACRCFFRRGVALAEEKVVTKLIAVKSPS